MTFVCVDHLGKSLPFPTRLTMALYRRITYIFSPTYISTLSRLYTSAKGEPLYLTLYMNVTDRTVVSIVLS